MREKSKETVKHRTKLSDQVLEKIRQSIVQGEFPLGTSLSEVSLAARYETSKTPVREAFMELRREGLVEIHAHRGTFVFSASEAIINNLMEIRMLLETNALRFSMERNWGKLVDSLEALTAQMENTVSEGHLTRYRELDAAFHRAIIDNSGNIFVQEAFSTFEFRIQALRTQLLSDKKNRETYQEHVLLVEQIATRNIELAIEKLIQHIDDSRKSLCDSLASQ
nr:GntR family transcriptional regulator [uncultured Cohaesibacter sp.]